MATYTLLEATTSAVTSTFITQPTFTGAYSGDISSWVLMAGFGALLALGLCQYVKALAIYRQSLKQAGHAPQETTKEK